MVLLAAFVVRVVTALIALVVAEVLLDDFSIDWWAYPLVAAIFAVVAMIIRPALDRLFQDRPGPSAVFAGIGAAFVALLATDLLTDGLHIEGALTWILATLIVWIAGILAELVIGRWLRGRIAGDRGRDRRR